VRPPARRVCPARHAGRTGNHLAPASSGQLWGLYTRSPAAKGGPLAKQDRTLVGVLWDGVNLIVAIPDSTDELLAEVADQIGARLTRPSGIVGEADVVLRLWQGLQTRWGPARAIREEQWLLALDGPPILPSPSPADASGCHLEPVRRSHPEDFDALLPAAVHMFMARSATTPPSTATGPTRSGSGG